MRTIYHVDDDPDFLSEVRILLESRYAVRSFLEPRRFHRALRTEHADLLLVDLDMPQMSGQTLLDRIRSSVRTSELPVIFLTGRADRSSRLRGLSRGLDDYILKPFDPEELLLRIENILRRFPDRRMEPSAILKIERLREAAAMDRGEACELVLSRAAAMLRMRTGAVSQRIARDSFEFSSPASAFDRAGRLIARMNRLLAKQGPLLSARAGYLEEVPAPRLVFELIRAE